MLPTDFTRIRQKLETSSVLSAAERGEWLVLLPKMTAEQLKELDRILSVSPPPAPAHPPQIATPDTLKALTVADLRRAPSVYKFLSNLAAQFRKLPPAEAEAAFEQSALYKAYVEAGVGLMEGNAPIHRPVLTREEVEAITDFRQSLRKTLNSKS